MEQDREITRDELQQLVWSKPTRTVAKAFGLSDRWTDSAFCRTIFDTLLQVALQHVNLLYPITHRPERGYDHADFPTEESVIHLAYFHGSILRHSPASATRELAGLARTLKYYATTYNLAMS